MRPVTVDRPPSARNGAGRAATVPAVVLVPIKAFHLAKRRLGSVLDDDTRERLARWTAERVLRSAGELPVAVVCDDDVVADWARRHGAHVLREEGLGLNGAVDHAIATLRSEGHAHVVVAHSDLARPVPLAVFARADTVVLVPDRRLDGTNVFAFPIGCDLRASYGAGSFGRHLRAALDTGWPVEVVRDPMLALDIDHPHDLTHPLVREALPAWLRTNPVNPSPNR